MRYGLVTLVVKALEYKTRDRGLNLLFFYIMIFLFLMNLNIAMVTVINLKAQS